VDPDEWRADVDRLSAQFAHARKLLRAGEFDSALAEFVLVWESRSSGKQGAGYVRFIGMEVGKLVRADARARVRFEVIRDALGLNAEAVTAELQRAQSLRNDWIVLNRALGDDERTLAWFDSVKDDPAAKALLDSVVELPEVLERHGRWRDLGLLVDQPLERLRDHFAAHGSNTGAATFAERFELNLFRDHASKLYRSLRAADRDVEAVAVLEEAQRLDPSEGMSNSLAQAAIGADKERHRR